MLGKFSVKNWAIENFKSDTFWDLILRRLNLLDFKGRATKNISFKILENYNWHKWIFEKNLKILTDHKNIRYPLKYHLNLNLLRISMNWLKKRKKSLLRVKPQNNFGTGNFDIFSTILPMGMFKKFLSTKLNVREVSEVLKWDTL